MNLFGEAVEGPAVSGQIGLGRTVSDLPATAIERYLNYNIGGQVMFTFGDQRLHASLGFNINYSNLLQLRVPTQSAVSYLHIGVFGEFSSDGFFVQPGLGGYINTSGGKGSDFGLSVHIGYKLFMSESLAGTLGLKSDFIFGDAFFLPLSLNVGLTVFLH